MLTPGPWFRRLRALARRGAAEREMDEEMRFHVAMEAEKLRLAGLSDDEARLRAARAFGPAARHREDVREARGAPWLETLARDVRYSVRTLRRSPGFTIGAVLTLALGIGANTAIFSVVDGVLLRPVPFRDADRLMMVWETDRNSGTSREPASVPDFEDFRERSTRFSELAAFSGADLSLTPRGGEPARVAALRATHEFLPMVGISPLVGRTFTPEDDREGAARVALIGERLWERRFARDPGVVGEAIEIEEVPYTVIGVLPEDAAFGTLQVLSAADYSRGFADRSGLAGVDVWLPLRAEQGGLPRSTHPVFVMGRLAAGATPEDAQREMTAIAAELERVYPENTGRGVAVQPLTEVVFGPVRPALLLLLGAVSLVLLVACANVANLLLARGLARTREVAVRRALGASAGRLGRQFLVESLVLALMGAVCGVALAYLALHLLLALAPADTARLSEVGIDLRALGLTLAATLAIGLAVGLVPLLPARRLDLQGTLRGARAASADGGRGRLRAGLVVAEIALATMLVVGAGLLVKSFWRLVSTDPGFRTEGVVKAEFQLPESRYPRAFADWPAWTEQHAFHREVLAEVGALPGVRSAAISAEHPQDPGFTNSWFVVGREDEASGWPEVSIRRVSTGYFATMGVPLVRGRSLGPADDATAPPVALVNEALARRYFPGEDPIGHQVSFWGLDRTIVGVVGDERFHGLEEDAPPAVYAPLGQAPSVNGAGTVLVRTDGDPDALLPAVRAAIRRVDPALAVFGLEPLQTTLSRSVGQRRFTALLLGVFAGLALLLAAGGVHGVLSYATAQRTGEIGLRMALGARRSQVLGMVLRQGLTLTALGALAGLAGALALDRVLAGLLFGVRSTDPAVLGAVVLTLAAVALLAALVPARRATRVEPMAALRAE